MVGLGTTSIMTGVKARPTDEKSIRKKTWVVGVWKRECVSTLAFQGVQYKV
jgi:hypothetical protein